MLLAVLDTVADNFFLTGIFLQITSFFAFCKDDCYTFLERVWLELFDNRGEDRVIGDGRIVFFALFIGLVDSFFSKRGEDRVGPVTTLSLSNSVTEESLKSLISITVIIKKLTN